MTLTDYHSDVAIVGAGAAGLAAAIFITRECPALRIVLLDGATKPGAKILVSGGGRCNVTNTVVRDSDFWGGRRTIVRRVLQALTVDETVTFFRELGVPLHEEPGGKLFPVSNRARDVLDALLRRAADQGVQLRSATRVHAIERDADHFLVRTSNDALRTRAVVLATGGRSLPKTGSDGGGYALAHALGHSLVPQTPALAPLVLATDTAHGIHTRVSGVAVDGEIAVWIDGAIATRLSGALLWTHFGVSGPLVLNASRHWARAREEHRDVRLTFTFHPGVSFEQLETRWTVVTRDRPRLSLRAMLGGTMADALAVAILEAIGLAPEVTLASLTREDRRRLIHALTAWPLPVLDTRGYNFAEVTAGGVALTEINPTTMESRVCAGLFLVGEILDVDGRIGGFNFQWAWSSARAAARGIAARHAGSAGAV